MGFFFRFKVRETVKKSSENDQKTVDWSFESCFFLNISRNNSKTSKLNRKSVLNL